MCMGGSSAPAPAPPAPTPAAPQAQDAGVVQARDNERRRRRVIASNTMLTGPQGDTSAVPTSTKTLLGA